jgi:hypothetical protein
MKPGMNGNNASRDPEQPGFGLSSITSTVPACLPALSWYEIPAPEFVHAATETSPMTPQSQGKTKTHGDPMRTRSIAAVVG